MKQENHKLLKRMRTHFKNNPQKLYSRKYFVKKWNLNYRNVRYNLEKLRKKKFLLKFYFSANQGLFAWGVPRPIFAVFVLNPLMNKYTVCKSKVLT